MDPHSKQSLLDYYHDRGTRRGNFRDKGNEKEYGLDRSHHAEFQTYYHYRDNEVTNHNEPVMSFNQSEWKVRLK